MPSSDYKTPGLCPAGDPGLECHAHRYPPNAWFFKAAPGPAVHLFVLSNTNGLHISWVNAFMERKYNAPSLEPWFDRTYYSHLVKARKPETASFEYVLQDAGIRPEETLYVEDTYENIESAKTPAPLLPTGGHDVITAKNYCPSNPERSG
jgi:methionine salvage enolase-phosphatase E1